MASTTSARILNERAASRMPWWLELIIGAATLGLGILMLTNMAATLLSVVLFLGWYWLISGIFAIGSLFVDRTGWGWRLVIGILGILAGLSVISSPLSSAILVPTVAAIYLGIQGLVSGAIELFMAVRQRDWSLGFLGVVNVLFGLFLLANPLIGVVLLPWLLGFFGIVGGAATIMAAFRRR